MTGAPAGLKPVAVRRLVSAHAEAPAVTAGAAGRAGPAAPLGSPRGRPGTGLSPTTSPLVSPRHSLGRSTSDGHGVKLTALVKGKGKGKRGGAAATAAHPHQPASPRGAEVDAGVRAKVSPGRGVRWRLLQWLCLHVRVHRSTSRTYAGSKWFNANESRTGKVYHIPPAKRKKHSWHSWGCQFVASLLTECMHALI